MQYTFNHAAAHQTIDEMARISNRLVNLLNGMEGQLQSCLVDWSDGAREAYTQAQLRWDSYAEQAPQLLARAQSALTEIEDRYRIAQHKAASPW